MAAGGICGSDLHYYQDGGFGPVRVREPIIAGHEASGFIEAIGDGVSGLKVGQLVAVNRRSPAEPANTAGSTSPSLPEHALHGSAMRLPHENGLFRDRLWCPPSSAIRCAWRFTG